MAAMVIDACRQPLYRAPRAHAPNHESRGGAHHVREAIERALRTGYEVADARPWYRMTIEHRTHPDYPRLSPGRSGTLGVNVALARNRSVALAADPLAEPAPLVAPWRGAIGRALPIAIVATPPARLRRCAYRRLSPATGRGAISSYSAECLYEGLDHAVALGDLDTARRACESCTRIGLWRADED